MPDAIFEHPRLAGIYDAFDGERDDLAPYLAIAKELGARSVIDIGCGTGSFACLLNTNGFDVTAIDPAEASLTIARGKPNAEGVTWMHGEADSLPALAADLAVMTGNVAQVFLTDQHWHATLQGIRRALRPGGYLVFEARDPAKKAWRGWTREKTRRQLNVPGAGLVEGWCDLVEAGDDLVTFRWTYVFAADGETIMSTSTLRFREKHDIARSLESAGYAVKDIRDAPDRPGLEFVFVAKAI